MTLLEALVALVVLGLTASGFLGVFGEGGRTAGRAAEWNAAVAAAEATMEGALLGMPPDTRGDTRGEPDADAVARFRPRVTVRPWPGAPRRIDELTATVTLSTGATFTLRRLVRREASAPGASAPGASGGTLGTASGRAP